MLMLISPTQQFEYSVPGGCIFRLTLHALLHSILACQPHYTLTWFPLLAPAPDSKQGCPGAACATTSRHR